MANVQIKGIDGSAKGSLALAEDVFDAPQNEVLVREVYNAWHQNQRQGTHSTKTRGFVSGGGRKPYAQKGTGNARQGSTRSPQFRHGAIVFGPLPRDYREHTPHKKRRAATRAVLSARASDGHIHLVDSFEMDKPSTKAVLKALDKIGAQGRVLILTSGVNENLVRSTRNLIHVRTNVANSLDLYELLVADSVVMTKEAAEEIAATFSTEKG